MITEENVDIDRLLIVTFTTAAASQMKEKILDAIYKKLEEEPENEHLRKQTILINKANISTIHAFCLNVIRNYFYEIGISPNARVGDTGELELLKQETIEDLFEEKYDEKNKEFLKLTENYANYRGDDELKELILRIYGIIQSTPFPEDWLEEAVERFNISEEITDFSETIWGQILLDSMKEDVKGYCASLDILRRKLNAEGLTKYEQTVIEDKQSMEAFLKAKNWEEAHKIATTINFSNWPIDKKVVSTLKDVARDKRKSIKESFIASVQNVALYSSEEAIKDISFVYPELVALKELVLQFESRFKKCKAEKNVLDFHDIEHFALKILTNKNEDGKYEISNVAKEYRNKFVEIAIDEYQDSNLIQDYILTTISNGCNIFMVGDVKQSIYKFRQARPKLFLDKYETYSVPGEKSSKGTKVLLFKNFRSRKEILNITNKLFETIMSKKLGEIEYTQEEYLNLGAEYDTENICYKPELHIITKENNEEEQEIETLENNELEAKFVANRIQELIKRKNADNNKRWKKRY